MTESAPTDHLRLCRRLVVVVLCVSAAIGASITIDAVFLGRTSVRLQQARLVGATQTADLALVPCGTPIGSPMSRHPAVDLRLTPFLPFAEPEPGELLIDKGAAYP